MKFQISSLSPVRAFVQGLRVSSAVYRVSANLIDLTARGVEAITSGDAIRALAGHLADATAPMEAVLPVGDRGQREAKFEVQLRKEIHGDVLVADAPTPCPSKSRSAKRRARAAVAAAVKPAEDARRLFLAPLYNDA